MPKKAPVFFYKFYGNTGYVTERVALIPAADAAARADCNKLEEEKLPTVEKRIGKDGAHYNHCMHTMFFHRHMTRLVEKLDLRCGAVPSKVL